MEQTIIDMFNRAYGAYVEPQPNVHHEQLRSLLLDVVAHGLSAPVDREDLISALERLTSFLNSARGRTTAHLAAVDHFFCDWDSIWRSSADGIPSDIADVFDTIAVDLHGALISPSVIQLRSNWRQWCMRFDHDPSGIADPALSPGSGLPT